MSIFTKFLNKSVFMTGLLATSIIALPLAQTSAQGQGRNVNTNNNNIVINNNGGGRGYDRGNRGGNRGGYRGNRRGGNGGAIIAGALGGALLYSALSNNRRYNTHSSVRYGYGNPYYGSRYYGPGYYGSRYGSRYGYAPRYRPAPRTRVVYVERPAAPVYAQPQQPYYGQQQQPAQPQYNYQPQQTAAQNSSCLQSREYQTTIEIGGESVPAYGQACLQQDGSWKFGDPIAAPSF